MSSLRRAILPACIAPALATLGYLLLALGYTFPLVTHLGSAVLPGLDEVDALQQTWVLAWVQHAILTNPGALYNAPIYYPQPNVLTYQDAMVPLALLMLPLAALLRNPLVLYNLAVLLSFPLCGLSMAVLAYRQCRDWRCAFLAGLIFAFCPYRARHLEHLNLLSAEAIPLLVLGFESARDRGGPWRWAACGAALVLASLLSLYYAAFTALALALYGLLLRFLHRPLLGRSALRGIWAALPFACAEALVLRPYIATQQAIGYERRLQDIVYFSADVRDFLHAAPGSLLYGWSDALWRIPALDVRQYLFPGLTAMGLAVIACLRLPSPSCTRRAAQGPLAVSARIYLAVAALLALCCLGPYLRLFGWFTHLPLPYLVVYQFVPAFAGLRDIGRFDQVLMAFVALAAAFGAQRLIALLGRQRGTRITAILAVLLMLEYWVVQAPLVAVPSGAAIPPVYHWLGRQPLGVTLELPMCGQTDPRCLGESSYVYYSVYHWHPLVNGAGGFFPADWDDLIAAVNSFPRASSLSTLHRLHVRYIIVHPGYPLVAAVRTALSRQRLADGEIVHGRMIGGDLVVVVPSSS